jgi:hypothetical protein
LFVCLVTLASSVCKCTPVVCLVIEGGTNTIRAVLEYVTDNPPVPVVVCDGSGRAADLIAFVHRHEHNVLETMKVEVCEKIKNTFEVSQEKAECLFVELLQCTLNKKLVSNATNLNFVNTVVFFSLRLQYFVSKMDQKAKPKN